MSLLRRHPCSHAARCRWLFAGLIGAALSVSVLFAQSGDVEGPLPIRWTAVKPEDIAKKLADVQKGALIQVPQKEFEARLERIRKLAQTRAEKPRLTRAHYSAELIDQALTNGSGQWTVHHAGADTAVLPIDPLNLALARAKWEHGPDAILADLDGKTLGLLVNSPGAQTCLFDWSARGTPNNEGVAFSLMVPLCSISTFELKLPANCWLSVPRDNAVVTGPHEAESPDKRLWKLQITGQTQFDLAVRKIAEPTGPAPTLFARGHSKQELAVDRIAIEHDFQVDILHGSVRELILDGAAGLQPWKVTLKSGEVKNWRWTEVAAKKDAKGKTLVGPGGVLTIQFDHPVQGKVQDLRVYSLAAQPTGAVWTSPGLRVRNATSRGETMEILLRSDFPVGKWDHGSFQPTAISTEPDGTQLLTLAETAPTPLSRRPSLVLQTPGVELHTIEQYQWHIGNRAADLKAEIQYTAARGNLFELNLKLPANFVGYQVESLEMQPAEMLRRWHSAGDTLIVDLKQALTPVRKAVLKMHLRSAYRELASGTRIMNYPEVQPIESARREGTVAVTVDPALQAQLLTSSIPLTQFSPTEQDQKTPAPSFSFTFRDQKLTASLRLTPQPVQVHWRGRHAVRLTEQEAALQFHWEAEPLVGTPDFVDFRFAPGFPSAWKLKTDEAAPVVQHWERLYLQEALPHLLTLGAQDGVQAALVASTLPTGSQWRFHFSEPLRRKARLTIEATSSPGRTEDEWWRASLSMPNGHPWECLAGALAADVLPKTGGTKVWSVPLVAPVQRLNVEQEIAVDSSIEPIDKVTTDGALVVRASPAQTVKASLHLQVASIQGAAFEHGSRLLLRTRPEKHATSLLELCDEASMTTYVRKDGTVYHRVQFRLWHWRDRTCDLHFPAGVTIVAARMHDQWLEQLDAKTKSSGTRLTLPCDQNAPFVRYEVYARADLRGSFVPGLSKVELPTLEWPIAPIDLRSRVCLQNGWMPLERESLAQVGVPTEIAQQSETVRWLRQVWNEGQSWWPYGAEAALQEKLDAQKQAVRLAEAQLRGGNAGKPLKLGETLERLALNHLKGTAPLVIDQVASRALGLSTETSVSAAALSPQAERPFWEALGLIYVPCPSGALLTTPRRLQDLGVRPSQPADLDGALQEAILHGRDASGGFCLILEWLRLPPVDVHLSPGETTFPIAEHFGDFRDLTEWEILPEIQQAGGFLVIDPLVGRIAGWLLAVLIALLLWRFHRATEAIACFRAHVLLLTVGVLAMIWMPVTVRELLVLPGFFAIGVGFFVCLFRLAGTGGTSAASGHSTIMKPAASAAVLAVLLFGITWSAPAQPPASRMYDVYLMGGKPPAVLMTPDLLTKMSELEKSSAGPGAVLVSAKYTGRVKDTVATIDVQYDLHSFKDKTHLVIPLTGAQSSVQLQEGAFLDGAPVYPTVHKNGYAVPIRYKGPHRLRLSFTVRAPAGSAQFDFRIPKLVQNEIALEWSAPVQAVHCPHSCGEEKWVIDARRVVKEWSAQLGYENKVQIRWTDSQAAPTPKSVDVKEAHFWDLRPASLTLWTSLHYAAGKGSLAQLYVALPKGLNVRSVEASALPSAVSVVVKNWQVFDKGGQPRLTVDLVHPVTGNLVLLLECVPQFGASQKQLLLSLPSPIPLQGKSVSGLLGYRLDAVEVKGTVLGAADPQRITPEEFEQLWKKQLGPAIPQASRAYSFQRKTPQAGLDLVIQPSARQAQFHLAWKVDLHHADLLGKFTFTSPREDMTVLDVFVDPALTLADVIGPDVRRWHRQGALLQVWLRQTRKEASFEIVGWRALPFQNNAPLKKSLPLPVVYPLNATFAEAALELQAAPGIQVDVEQLRRLRPSPLDKHRFLIDDVTYGASIALRLEQKPPQAIQLTKAHGTPDGVEIWHGIRLKTDRGRLPGLKLHLKDWPHESLILDAPGTAAPPVKEKVKNHWVWTIKYPPGLPGEVFLTLRGHVAKDKQASVALPTVAVEGAVVEDAWLAWQGLEVQAARKLGNQKKAHDQIGQISNESWQRDLDSWNCAEAQPSMRAVLPKTVAGAGVRSLASTERARLMNGRWLHEASIWIHAPQAADLRVKFAAPVDQFSALTDRRIQSAWTSTAQEFVLPLEPGLEPRFVRMRWTYAAGTEQMDAPSIAPIQIDQVALPVNQRVVEIPPGMTLAASESRSAATLALRLLHQAEIEMRLAEAIAQESPTVGDAMNKIAARQEQFFACLRQTEYALAIAKNAEGAFDSAIAIKRLNDLKSENAVLATKHQYNAQREAAQKVKKLVVRPAAGANRFAAGIPVLLTPSLPSLPLQSAQARVSAENRTRAEWFLLAVVFLLVFSYFRHGLSLARRFAPEIGIVITAGVLFVYGVNPIGVFLIGAMLLLRLWWITTYLKRRFGLTIAAVSTDPRSQPPTAPAA